MSNRKSPEEMTPEELEKAREIVFYCKDCGYLVHTIKVGKKYVYKCKVCGTKNVAFGSRRSIFGFYSLDEEKLAKVKLERENRQKEKKDEGKGKGDRNKKRRFNKRPGRR